MKSFNFITSLFSFLNSNFVKVMDWLIAFGLIAYAASGFFGSADISTSHYVCALIGAASLLMAWKRPSEAIESAVRKNVIKNR